MGFLAIDGIRFFRRPEEGVYKRTYQAISPTPSIGEKTKAVIVAWNSIVYLISKYFKSK